MTLGVGSPEGRPTVLTVDYEGQWGMPHRDASYDLARSTEEILIHLAEHRVRGVFFVVGRLVDEHPTLIERIAEQGHEIGIHGYSHERLHRASPQELDQLSRALEGVLARAVSLIGWRPVGFRAPHLMGPAFYSAALYGRLDELGFRWVSNREVRFPEEALHPHRTGKRLWRVVEKRGFLLYPLALGALNLRQTAFDRQSLPARSVGRCLPADGPFRRGRLVELPLLAPMDCDLLGLPAPKTPSPPALVDYAAWSIDHRCRTPSRWMTLTFHDWIIGSANRLTLLDRAIASANRSGGRWIRPGIDEMASLGVRVPAA